MKDGKFINDINCSYLFTAVDSSTSMVNESSRYTTTNKCTKTHKRKIAKDEIRQDKDKRT